VLDRLPAMADAYDKGISVVTVSKLWGGCAIIFPLAALGCGLTVVCVCACGVSVGVPTVYRSVGVS
jgi:hypothetical protein